MSSKLQELFNEYNSDFDYYNINHIDDYIGDGCYKHTLLHGCVMDNFIELTKRCIELGADVNKRDSFNKPTLYLALWDNDYEIAELLIKSGANPNIRVNDNPLICCNFCLTNHKIIKLLVRHGTLLNEVSNYTHTLPKKFRDIFKSLLAKRRWVKIKCIVFTLNLHKRAVERVNDPDRLKELGTFEEL